LLLLIAILVHVFVFVSKSVFPNQASYLESMHALYEETRASAEASLKIAEDGLAEMVQFLEEYMADVSEALRAVC
jgi:hypothetical protein